MSELNKAKEDESWKAELVRREKERLLKEHLPNLQGYAPK